MINNKLQFVEQTFNSNLGTIHVLILLKKQGFQKDFLNNFSYQGNRVSYLYKAFQQDFNRVSQQIFSKISHQGFSVKRDSFSKVQ